MAQLAGALVPPAKRKVAVISLDVSDAMSCLALPLCNRDLGKSTLLLIAVLQGLAPQFSRHCFQSLIPRVLSQERTIRGRFHLSRIRLLTWENLFSQASLLSCWSISFSLRFVSSHVPSVSHYRQG